MDFAFKHHGSGASPLIGKENMLEIKNVNFCNKIEGRELATWKQIKPVDGGAPYEINLESGESRVIDFITAVETETNEASEAAHEISEEGEESLFLMDGGAFCLTSDEEDSESDEELEEVSAQSVAEDERARASQEREAMRRGTGSNEARQRTPNPIQGATTGAKATCPQWWTLFNWGSRAMSDIDPRCHQIAFIHANCTGGSAFTRAAQQKGKQYVNRLPGMNTATAKTHIARALEGSRFMPESWRLPEDAAGLEAAPSSSHPVGEFMIKPDGGQSGIGCQVCTSMTDVLSYWRDHEEPAVVQRYIEPMLYRGTHKWDLRLF